MPQSAFSKVPTNFTIISSSCHFTNLQSTIIIYSEPKTARREHSNDTIFVILILYNMGKSHSKITNYVKILKLIVM